MTIRELPIACTLDSDNRATREQEWSALFADSLIERQAITGGVALKLKRSPDAVSRLTNLIELERRCCSWIKWSITDGEAVLVQATSSHEDGARLLAQWFGVSLS